MSRVFKVKVLLSFFTFQETKNVVPCKEGVGRRQAAVALSDSLPAVMPPGASLQEVPPHQRLLG
jgi:hypothetical protein